MNNFNLNLFNREERKVLRKFRQLAKNHLCETSWLSEKLCAIKRYYTEIHKEKIQRFTKY